MHVPIFWSQRIQKQIIMHIHIILILLVNCDIFITLLVFRERVSNGIQGFPWAEIYVGEISGDFELRTEAITSATSSLGRWCCTELSRQLADVYR